MVNKFVDNIDKNGNIFGLDITLDDAILPNEFKKSCLFFSYDTILCAWREILLSHVPRSGEKNIGSILDKYVNDKNKKEKFIDHSDTYIRIIRNVNIISKKLMPEIGFFYYNASLGLELYFLGLHEKFFEINKGLANKISNSGIRKMVIYSPQEHLAINLLKEKYNLDIELVPFLELVGRNVDKFNRRGKKYRVIPQESCIMTRWLGFEDYIDWLKIDGIEITRHPLKGKLTVCCGEHMWYIDPNIAIRNATERLKSLAHVGGMNVLVTCPNALFLFKVAKELNKDELEKIRLTEISEVLVNLL